MRWTLVHQTGVDTPGARSSHALAVIGSTAWLYGGERQPRLPLPADLYACDLSTGNWRLVQTRSGSTSPGPRVAATMCAVGSRLYLFGGRTGVDISEGARSDLCVLDTAAEQLEWQAVQPSGDASYHAMAASSKRLFVFGGCGPAGRLSDLWQYDAATNAWTQLPSCEAVAPRGGAVLVADAAHVYVLGGFDGTRELQDCHVLDLSTHTWDSSSGLTMPLRRSVFGAVVHTCGGSSNEEAGAAARACSHDGHIVAWGGEVAPSDKGHAGAGNFTTALLCMAPSASGSAASDADSSTCTCAPATRQWHALIHAADCQAGGGSAENPQPRGWFATARGPEGALCIHGGLGGDNERLSDMWLLQMH